MLRYALLAALLPVAALAQEQWSQPTSAQTQQATAQQERGTESAPLVVKAFETEESKRAVKRKDAQEDEKLTLDKNLVKFTESLALYTKLLFTATAILAVATGGMVFVGFRQIRDAKDSIAATQKSAAAAERTAKTGERALLDLERAYIFGGPGGRAATRDSPHRLVIVLTIQNTGKTPGFLEEICWGLCLESDFPNAHWYDKTLDFEDIVPPGGEPKMFERVSAALPPGGPHVFYGRISYRDIFGIHRHSGWRHRIDHMGNDEPMPGAYSDWT
jgi:hypothetical protein